MKEDGGNFPHHKSNVMSEPQANPVSLTIGLWNRIKLPLKRVPVLFKRLIIYWCACACICKQHVHADIRGPRKRALDSQDTELRGSYEHQMWVLEANLKGLVRAACDPTPWLSVSSGPQFSDYKVHQSVARTLACMRLWRRWRVSGQPGPLCSGLCFLTRNLHQIQRNPTWKSQWLPSLLSATFLCFLNSINAGWE